MAWIEKREGRKKPYRVHFKDKFSGKKRNKSFVKRKGAQAFLETVGSDENVIVNSDTTVTVFMAMQRWYSLCTTTGRNGRPPVEESTSEKYDLHRRILNGIIGERKLAELSKKDCNDLRDELLTRYSRPYAKKILTSFKSALLQAVSDDVIPKSSARDTNIQISSREKKANQITIPSLEEIGLVTNAIEQLMRDNNQQIRLAWKRYGPLFFTMLYTGMRPSETRGLAWSSINWDKKLIVIEQRADNKGNLGALKSASGYRSIPVADDVLHKLKEWQEDCPSNQLNLVFPNFRGNVESLSNITNRGWYVLCRKAGLTYTDENGKLKPRYNLYSLRHTKASIEIALNRSPKRIQTVMGHANIRITMDTYGHLFEDDWLQDDPNEIAALIKMGAQRAPKNSQITDIIN